jgi:thiol-disulfide isomerase/thioredoxin
MLATLVVVSVFALSAAVPTSAQQQPVSTGEGLKTLPAINLQDLDGKPVSSEKLKGQIIVLDFWATWCGPCIVEIPHYNKIEEKYSSKGVKVVGVTLASGEAKEVKPFVSRHKMKYSVFMGDDNQAYDFNIVGFPTTYLVTRDWKIYKRWIGANPHKAAQIEAEIDKLLSEEAGRPKQSAAN